MFSHSYRKGFTLLELLIVIAIIGVLVAITTAVFNDSRDKSTDAGVKQNLLNARTKASLFFAENSNSYDGICVDTNIRRMIQAAVRSSHLQPNPSAYADSDIGDWDSEACHDSDTGYAIWVPLSDSTSGTASGWCIDSTNTSTKKTGVNLGASSMTC